MKKNTTIVCLLLSLFFTPLVKGQYFSAMSNWFPMDTDVPNVSNWCPQEGTVYLPGQQVFLDYYIYDNNLTTVQLGFSSEINGDTLIIGTLPETGPTTITIPQIVTSTAKLYIIASDSFGHVNYFPVPEYGYFGIGTAAQEVSIPQGWSGLSSVYVPQDTEISNIFGENLDDVIIVQDLENIFWPGGNVFTLNNWEVMQGYLIKTQNAFNMSFVGSTPECDVSAGVDEGWDLIPIVASCDIDAESFMSWYLWSSDMIKEAAGWRMYWPEYNIKSLEVLERGKAYFVHSLMVNNDFLFGPCWEEEKSAFAEKPDIPEIWDRPAFSPGSHVFAIPGAVLTEAGIGKNWTLGAFSMNGLCAGVAPAEALHLTVFADDPTTEQTDGLIPGETVFFRAWNPEKQIQTGLIPEFDMNLPQTGVFRPNGISAIIHMKTGAVGIAENSQNQISIFPNPASDELFITTKGNVGYLITISDINGSIVMTRLIEGNTRLDISGLLPGVYGVKATNGQNVVTRKLLII